MKTVSIGEANTLTSTAVVLVREIAAVLEITMEGWPPFFHVHYMEIK
jgi:hypothetical protein